MDQLELLKKNWKNSEPNFPKLSYNEIYNMLSKRSTSIVKWIFIISVLELLLWVAVYFVSPKSSYEVIDKLGMKPFMTVTNVIHYLVFLTFVYYFYKNYSSIKVTDSTRTLMERILKTRKTVRYFVIYNVMFFIVSLIAMNYAYYTKSDLLIEYLGKTNSSTLQQTEFLNYFFIAQIVAGILFILLLLLFYRVVYGILLRKLKKNYKKLEQIEV